MNSIHFIPFHRCILVHWVLFTPFGTNPGPYEPVMWGFNPYFWELPKTRPNSSRLQIRHQKASDTLFGNINMT